MIGEKGKLFCFEPLPKQYATLTNLIKQKKKNNYINIENIQAYNLALGNTEGETTFTMVPDFPE